MRTPDSNSQPNRAGFMKRLLSTWRGEEHPRSTPINHDEESDERHKGPILEAHDQSRQGVAASPSISPLSPEAVESELMTRLRRTLEGRCDVLLRSASAETLQSDAPMVLAHLAALDETVVRQPPAAAQRALTVARNSLSSSAQLAAIFAEDPALTEALLRTANSPYYLRRPEPYVSISEAIQTVGTRGVEMIVTTAMVEGLLCRPGSAYATLLSEVWAHMMRTAPLARPLAPSFDVAPETGFTVGLLHDVGKLVVFDHLSQLRSKHHREIKVPERFLLDMLNRLHESVGGIAVLRWNLGNGAAEAIACHHFEPPPREPNRLAELLCVAERCDHAVRRGIRLNLDHLWDVAELTGDISQVRRTLEDVEGLPLGRGHSSAKRAA